jgi:glucokinase-like ROK family protein
MKTVKASGPVALRKLNRGLVLDILRVSRPISRTGLARAARLSKPTISVIVEQLLALDLVREIGLGSSRRGRRPVMLDFNPDARLVVGAELQEPDWVIVLTNLDGKILRRHNVANSDPGPEQVVEALTEGVREICSQVEPSHVLGLGIGVPGTVSVRTGIVALALNLGWVDVPLKQLAEEQIDLPVAVANRCKAEALAEKWHGVGRDIEDLIYVRVGTGIGAGFVHQGELFLGSSYAGELGHCTVYPNGPICACGNRGCLEALASGPALAARARRRVQEGAKSLLSEMCDGQIDAITAKMVEGAARQGDDLAKEVLTETGTYLGLAVGTLLNLYNPQMVVLGGPVSRAGKFLLDPLREEAQRRSLGLLAQDVRFEVSVLDRDAGPIGAATMISRQLNDLLDWSVVDASNAGATPASK